MRRSTLSSCYGWAKQILGVTWIMETIRIKPMLLPIDSSLPNILYQMKRWLPDLPQLRQALF